MSKDPGYSDSKKDTLESRNRFLQERNEILINKIEYLNQVNDGLHLLLKEAEAKEKKLVDVLKFYADTDNWLEEKNRNNLYTIIKDDASDDYNDALRFGGKLARQVLKEIGEE